MGPKCVASETWFDVSPGSMTTGTPSGRCRGIVVVCSRGLRNTFGVRRALFAGEVPVAVGVAVFAFVVVLHGMENGSTMIFLPSCVTDLVDNTCASLVSKTSDEHVQILRNRRIEVLGAHVCYARGVDGTSERDRSSTPMRANVSTITLGHDFGGLENTHGRHGHSARNKSPCSFRGGLVLVTFGTAEDARERPIHRCSCQCVVFGCGLLERWSESDTRGGRAA